MIQINNLEFSYSKGTDPVLVGIDMAVNSQSLFGLLGPNGAGKTTLLSILSGLLPCPPGRVVVDGIDIARDPSKVKSIMSLVPQEYAFYPMLTVKENLRFFAGILAISKPEMGARIDEVATITGLNDRLGMRAQRLSGGLMRRLNMAIGLLNKPRLLFLDEPTVGIDPHSRRFILEAIKDINNQGTTIVYTSHYMEEVEYLCDDIAIIDQGKVLAKGAMHDLLHTEKPEALILDLVKPLSSSQLEDLQQSLNVTQSEQSLTILVEEGSKSIYHALEQLKHHQVVIERIHYGNRNLEELFLHLTHRSLRD